MKTATVLLLKASSYLQFAFLGDEWVATFAKPNGGTSDLGTLVTVRIEPQQKKCDLK